MNSKLILLNGPPKLNKNIIAHHVLELLRASLIESKYPTLVLEQFSKPLKLGVMALYDQWDEPANEKSKDLLSEGFFDRSYRKAQIDLFHHLERLHGEDILGHLFNRRIKGTKNEIIIVSDAGRQSEVHAATLNFSLGDSLLVRLHNRSSSYVGDIRRYVSNTESFGVDAIDVNHDTEIATASLIVKDIITRWKDLPWKHSQHNNELLSNRLQESSQGEPTTPV